MPAETTALTPLGAIFFIICRYSCQKSVTLNKTVAAMKNILFICCFVLHLATFAQKGYPVPADSHQRLFYIQHSNNHNTFVYDANLTGKVFNTSAPVNAYRITYTKGKGGIKEELTAMQRKMAYGVTIAAAETASCAFTLAAYPAKKIFVRLEKDGKPSATVNVNGKNIVLKKMFLSVTKSGMGVEYIDFYGKDASTHKEVVERLLIKE